MPHHVAEALALSGEELNIAGRPVILRAGAILGGARCQGPGDAQHGVAVNCGHFRHRRPRDVSRETLAAVFARATLAQMEGVPAASFVGLGGDNNSAGSDRGLSDQPRSGRVMNGSGEKIISATKPAMISTHSQKAMLYRLNGASYGRSSSSIHPIRTAWRSSLTLSLI